VAHGHEHLVEQSYRAAMSTTSPSPSPSPSSTNERGERFRRLHDGPGAFVIPNPWDVGTARVLASFGFPALATTSAGHAFSAGHPDGRARRDDVLDHVVAIVDATDLPVSADLEDGLGSSPEQVAATFAAVGGRGAVGGSIEDRPSDAPGLHDLGLAVERVRAAAEAARALPFPFTLTARSDGFIAGRPDLGETVRRLLAYQEAGADVLYAPGLTTRNEIEAVTSSVDRPVNVVVGLGSGPAFDVAELAGMGVRRVSLGSTLSRVAFGALLRAAEELATSGTFGFVEHAVPFARINTMLEQGR
jgi:2-methylisocitrate lyase-like PEP mutase family enzyme